ncbi:Transmembrane protein 14C [Porphyridium purpureum]|uniref:Transmembrane protein 14C n=1 Tax=Porphyridium purpureum TaxID=35688 RepID=A0A5J4YYC0_PORPP|nr:Transmembrane protein 14C [Porphyridium purpureum]|eukprot:POR5065..scf209_3
MVNTDDVKDPLTLALGALVAAGGLLGFVKANSKPSLIAGGVLGGLLGVAAFVGAPFGLAASSVLAALMGVRFINSKKLMPSGLITVLALANVARLVLEERDSFTLRIQKPDF